MVIGRVARWWRGRTQVERFDLYTRWSLYGLAALAPFMITWMAADTARARPGLAVAVVTVSLVQTGLGFVVIRAALSRRRDGDQPAPVRPILAMALATLVGLILAARELGENQVNPWLGIVFFVMPFVGALSLAMPLRYATLGLFVTAGAPVVTYLLMPNAVPSQALPALGVVTLFTGLGAIGGYRGSLWMLDVVWELDRARDAQARLAVAEERLRFARDLHDVVGRGLSVISLKSDLAAQLAKRGRTEAADEMLEVRRLAQDLLSDVREVVRGYRTTDLGAELTGARSVLSSAGIDCRIVGSQDSLSEQAQATLGWVVREGTTNVLRHSQARACTIRVEVEDSSVRLSMENDGSNDGGPLTLGNGLLGLTERLAAVGGALTAQRLPGARFRLTAELPR